jgi:hypothetical protein
VERAAARASARSRRAGNAVPSEEAATAAASGAGVMRLTLACLAIVGCTALLARKRLACWLRGRHDPARQPVGGFRCAACERALADLEEAGLCEVQLPRLRTYYDRGNGITRTSLDPDELRKAGL